MSEWISVNDRLPKIGQKVMLYSNGVVQEDLFVYDADNNERQFFWYNKDLDDYPFLQQDDQWQPLPEPPEGL